MENTSTEDTNGSKRPKLPFDGRFQKGNNAWTKRSKHGRNRIFSEPQTLLDAFGEYMDITGRRKWNKVDFRGKDNKRVKIPNETPFTLSGLCNFLGVNEHYFNDFEKSLDLKVQIDSDFSDVIRTIRGIIWTQKFEGGTVGAFNPNIIAMELGLKSKIENEVKYTTPLFGEEGEDGRDTNFDDPN